MRNPPQLLRKCCDWLSLFLVRVRSNGCHPPWNSHKLGSHITKDGKNFVHFEVNKGNLVISRTYVHVPFCASCNNLYAHIIKFTSFDAFHAYTFKQSASPTEGNNI